VDDWLYARYCASRNYALVITPNPSKKTIELNPDGTAPHQRIGNGWAGGATYTATSTYSTNPNLIPDPPKKKTWKDVKKELAGYYLLFAVMVGTMQFIVWIIEGIIKLVKWL
jgi:hypothetical protein